MVVKPAESTPLSAFALAVLAERAGRVPERTRNAGRVTPGMGLSDAEWLVYAEGATKIAEAVKSETSLRTAFHHHCAGHVETPRWDYFQAVREGVFCELGKGEIDFPSLMTELKKLDYDGWGVVEQDVLPGMGKPKESAKRKREYIRSLGY